MRNVDCQYTVYKTNATIYNIIYLIFLNYIMYSQLPIIPVVLNLF